MSDQDFTTDCGLRAEAVMVAERFLAECPPMLHCLRGRKAPSINRAAVALMRTHAQAVIDGGGIMRCMIRWSRRATFRRFGAFHPSGKGNIVGPLIEVSSMMKAEGCHRAAKDTLAHEVAHWIASAAGRDGRGHGPIWKEVARMCGGEVAASRLAANLPPEVEAEVARLRRARNGRSYIYACESCEVRIEFSPRCHKRSAQAIERRGAETGAYRHTGCNGALIWTKEVTE